MVSWLQVQGLRVRGQRAIISNKSIGNGSSSSKSRGKGPSAASKGDEGASVLSPGTNCPVACTGLVKRLLFSGTISTAVLK